jgi:tRNA(Ile)-lysidine synthase
MIHDDFAERFERQFPHRVGGRVLVALSGGADSVALLHLLRGPDLDLTLEAAHVHHLVRRREADEDAAFCEALCLELDIPFHLLRLDPDTAPAEGLEAAWRRARYRALDDLRRRRELDAVATGHHRDDVAEGVLMQLLRGGGPRALAGIASETPDGVLRPLLSWTRAEIVEWLRDNRIDWREDSSNTDLNHLRNRVRHVLLPSLRLASPKIDTHLVDLAGRLADDEEFFASELRDRDLWIEPWSADGGVRAARIRAMPRPIRARWLHAQARRSEIGRVSRRQLELFHQLVETGRPRGVALAGRWRLLTARRRLWLEPPETPPAWELELEPGGRFQLPIPGMEVLVGSTSEDDASTEDSSSVEGGVWRWEATPGRTLMMRSPAADDVVHGPSGGVRLSKVLAKQLPRHLRRAWPVFCENGTITWIPGVWQASERGSLPVEVVAHGGPAGGVQR